MVQAPLDEPLRVRPRPLILVRPEVHETGLTPTAQPVPVPPARPRTTAGRVLALATIDLAAPIAWLATEPANPGVPAGLAAGIVATYAWAGLYRRRITQLLLDDLPYILLGVLVGLGFAALAVILGPNPDPQRTLLWLGIVLAAVVLGRAVAYSRRRRASRHGRSNVRVLILGTGQPALDLAHRSTHHPHHGASFVGFVGERSDVPLSLPVPWLGDYDDIGCVIERLGIDVVACAFPDLDEQELARLLRHRVPRGVLVYSLPNGYDISRGTGRLGDRMLGTPLVRLGPRKTSHINAALKRDVDVLLAVLGLIFAAPFMIAVAIAVRIELGPGILFRQERIGQGGRPFTLLKFRSMHPAKPGDAQTRWSIAGDAQIGPVGRTIRATSLDELPQLLNILRGDMSIVGPRPERPFFVERYSKEYPDYADRHRAPVGLTGHAAINGLRGDTDIAERVRYDNAYIDNWSLWRDAKITLRTVNSVFRRHGS